MKEEGKIIGSRLAVCSRQSIILLIFQHNIIIIIACVWCLSLLEWQFVINIALTYSFSLSLFLSQI